MDQVPSWLEAAVFAAGITAYAEEVEGLPLPTTVSEHEPDDSEPSLH